MQAYKKTHLKNYLKALSSVKQKIFFKKGLSSRIAMLFDSLHIDIVSSVAKWFKALRNWKTI